MMSLLHIESIMELDRALLSWFNGSHSMFLDAWMTVLTSGVTWLPLYVALLYMVVKNNEAMTHILLVVSCVALCILLADGMADGIAKPMVQRWRPSNDPFIKYGVEIVSVRGSSYGFFSAHAANTFSLAVFVSMLVRSRLMTVSLVAWSLVNCYTRMYLGLHYPSDILCGLLWGGLSALVSYMLYLRIFLRLSPVNNYVSSHYTCTGYSYNDIDNVMLVLMLTLAYTLLRAVYMVF